LDNEERDLCYYLPEAVSQDEYSLFFVIFFSPLQNTFKYSIFKKANRLLMRPLYFHVFSVRIVIMKAALTSLLTHAGSFLYL